MRTIALMLLLFMSACAVRHEASQAPVNNPYQARAEGLARSGVDAMGREQWKSAQILFGKSLQAATLADDDRLISLGWYNLGRANAAGGNAPAARSAYQQAMRQAEKGQDAVNRQRAGLALALLDQHAGKQLAADKLFRATGALLRVPDTFPIDVHFAAARLAYLELQPDLARHAYARVLEMAGPDRTGLIYAARAHLGLARLSRSEVIRNEAAVLEGSPAWQHLHQALDILHRAGEPRLMLLALNLAAEMEIDSTRRQSWLQRAAALQQALHEVYAD